MTKSKLLNKNRKAEIMSKIHSKMQTMQHFNNANQNNPLSQDLSMESNEEVSKQLSKILQQNQSKKQLLQQSLLKGPSQIDLSEEMQSLQWRIDILRNSHRHSQSKNKNSLISEYIKDDKSGFNQVQVGKEFTGMSFDQLYKMQKDKYQNLRERRKAKRSNIQYIEMIGNKESRKEKKKQLNNIRFEEQMKILDETIAKQ